jgi:hypothetical protein
MLKRHDGEGCLARRQKVAPSKQESRNWHRMIFAALARAFATQRAANSTRSSFF